MPVGEYTSKVITHDALCQQPGTSHGFSELAAEARGKGTQQGFANAQCLLSYFEGKWSLQSSVVELIRQLGHNVAQRGAQGRVGKLS